MTTDALETYLTATPMGLGFFVFRVNAADDTQVTKLPGVYRSKRAANAAARKEAARTGEAIR